MCGLFTVNMDIFVSVFTVSKPIIIMGKVVFYINK
jgi:hypothetical protein